MDMAFFRSMVENGTGFQSYYDDYPHLNLVECIQASATDCMAAQIELAESVQSYNDRCIEATHMFLTEGVSIDYDALSEASKEGLLQKIKNFFARIKKWVQSIIAKIKVSIDKKRLTGKQFYERYKDHPGLSNIAAKNLVFNGFKMDNASPFELNSTDVDSMINSAYGIATPKAGQKPSDSNIKQVSDDNASSRQAKLAGKLTGITGLGSDSWKEDLHKKVFGEKTEMKYGTGMFTLDKVKSQLQSADGFETILKSYTELKGNIEKSEKAMTDTVNSIKSGYEKQHKDNDTQEKTAKYSEEAALTDYCTKYLALYQEAINVLQSVQAIRVSYQDTRMNQAKRMFQMMITGKVEKKDNNDFELEAAEFDFDFA